MKNYKGVVAATNNFYQWEQRGRGWFVFPERIDIEPPFIPFYHSLGPSEEYFDDGAVPTLWERFKRLLWPVSTISEVSPYDITELKALSDTRATLLGSLSICFPENLEVHPNVMEQLLIMMSSCQSPISFEVIADNRKIEVQIVCSIEAIGFIQNQIQAYFPEAILNRGDDWLDNIIKSNVSTSILELGLESEFMCPLGTWDNNKIDPLAGLYAVLDNLPQDHRCSIQFLFKFTEDPWAESIISAVTDSKGKPFFLDAPELTKWAKEKIQSPLVSTVVRIISQAPSPSEANRLTQDAAASIIKGTQSPFNSLIGLSNEAYPLKEHLQDVVERKSRRLGFIINSQELSSLVHFPSSYVTSRKLNRLVVKSHPAPEIALNHKMVIGNNTHQGQTVQVSLSEEQRFKHVHLLGATGTGKSTLLLNMIRQDMQLGNGIAVLDPHGDLIDAILTQVPQDRINDVILIDPADSEFPIGFNILSAHTEFEQQTLASDLVSAFRRFSTSWGDQMNTILANAILAILESSKRGTLIDLRRFLIEKEFREEYLQSVSDPSIVYYWQKEYPLTKGGSIGSILTRLDTFLRPKVIRNMVAQQKSLNFAEIMNGRKILLLRLSQGLIGTENSYLLGSFFVSKLYQTALSRQSSQKEARVPFFTYIDEFQNFITPSLVSILSGARKYHFGLVLAHQDMRQLANDNQELTSSLLTNIGTRICFKLGDNDSKGLEAGFAHFTAQELANLKTGEAICRLNQPENDFNLAVPFNQFSSNRETASIEQIRSISRTKYAVTKSEIEAFINSVYEVRDAKKPITEHLSEASLTNAEDVIQPVAKSIEPEVVEIKESSTIERLEKRKRLTQHRYLQTLIKKMAEARGYKASIELPTADGLGKVDVALEKNGKRLACEIGVTTAREWEVHNIVKCLADGFDVVIAVPQDAKSAELMRTKLEASLTPKDLSKVEIFEADQLFEYLDNSLKQFATEPQKIKGYNVKIEYQNQDAKEQLSKKQSIAKLVINSVAKRKDKISD